MQQIEQASDLHGCISTGFTTKDLQNTQVKSSVYEPGCVIFDVFLVLMDDQPHFSFLADHLYT